MLCRVIPIEHELSLPESERLKYDDHTQAISKVKMTTLRKGFWIFVAAIFFCVIIAPVKADWYLTDNHKMHNPQLPDPNGWDVANYNNINDGMRPLPLADDWLCTETCYVTDIHIWGSWNGDRKGEIESFDVEIRSDYPAIGHPGELLWRHTFSGSEIKECYWGNGSQGWWKFIHQDYYSPGINWQGYDHNDTWQYNLHIDNSTKAFIQQKGTTYWLAITPHVSSSGYEFGWKTSKNLWGDDFAVGWPCQYPKVSIRWWSISQIPRTPSYSLAFVIDGPPLAPEVPLLTPTGLIALVSLLSAVAAVAIVRKRR
jgi:hypothetical protein